MLPSITTAFTPLTSLVGGVLIGLSVVLLMFSLGRIAGISGITTTALRQPLAEYGWRLSFLLGLILAPVLMTRLGGIEISQTVSGNVPGMLLAGGLVGLGTVLGSGCTSGHGVCGLARLSTRSLTAVLVFIAAAMVTVWVLRHAI